MKYTKCEICNKLISNSNYKKHLQGHKNHPENYTEISYHVDHDDLFCKFCGKECKNKNSLAQHEIRCKENPERIEIHNGFSNYNKNKNSWNRGKTKYTDSRVLKGSLTYQKNKELGLHNSLSGDKNPSKRPEVRQKISNTCLEKSKNGQWHTSLSKNMHIDYNGVDLHGTWEFKYAQFLDKNNVKWVRCVDRFPYFYENKLRYYTPDFYLIETNEYVEIKGYKTIKDENKWSQFPQDKKLIILLEKDLKELNII